MESNQYWQTKIEPLLSVPAVISRLKLLEVPPSPELSSV
jgi:hypothetical protein